MVLMGRSLLYARVDLPPGADRREPSIDHRLRIEAGGRRESRGEENENGDQESHATSLNAWGRERGQSALFPPDTIPA